MKCTKQKIILCSIPLLYLIIFIGLKSMYSQDLLVVQKGIYPIAVLAFTVVVDALLTVLILLFSSHLWTNVFGGITFVMAIVLYNAFHSNLGLFCNPSSLIWSMTLSYIAAYLVKYLLSRSNKRLVNAIVGAYFSRRVRKNIVAGLAACEPICKPVTILECSITDLDRLIAENSPKDLFSKVNFVLETVIDRVIKSKGRVDKFIGSKIYAYWENEQDAYLAVKSAMDACAYLDETGVTKDVKLAIGVHFAEAYLGVLGTSKVMNYSMLSPEIDVLEQIVANCSLYNKRILISKPLYKQGWKRISAIKVATLNLRGVGNSTELYEPLEVKRKLTLAGFEVNVND